MFAKAIFSAVFLAATIPAAAADAAPEWIYMTGNNADNTFVDSRSFQKEGNAVEVDVLRNFNKTITLGNDPVTDAVMYPHRSVKVTYKVDCATGSIAMSGWTMYAGNLGNGEAVWADKAWGKLAYTAANDDETRAVLSSSCATNTASR